MNRERQDILMRLKRIEGQVRGLLGMVERGSPCLDVLTQVSAVIAAMKKVGAAMLGAYMEECLKKDLSNPEELTNTLKDLREVVSRYLTWS